MLGRCRVSWSACSAPAPRPTSRARATGGWAQTCSDLVHSSTQSLSEACADRTAPVASGSAPVETSWSISIRWRRKTCIHPAGVLAARTEDYSRTSASRPMAPFLVGDTIGGERSRKCSRICRPRTGHAECGRSANRGTGGPRRACAGRQPEPSAVAGRAGTVRATGAEAAYSYILVWKRRSSSAASSRL